MKTRLFLTASIAAILAVVASCNKADVKVALREPHLPTTAFIYVDSMPTPTHGNPWGSGSDPDNTPTFNLSTNKGATLGRVLFYDRVLSLNNTISCGSCHKQQYAFADNVDFSTGYEGKLTARNSMPIVNESMNRFFFFDGRTRTLETQTLQPVKNHVEMGMEKIEVLPQKIKSVPYYAQLFKDAFGNSDITEERIAYAMSQFMRAMKSKESKFDIAANMQNNFAGLTVLEQEGMHNFDKFRCSSCHVGNNFNSNGGDFANIGLDVEYTDKGLKTVTGNSTDDGRFRIPSLRNVALTAPYMHDGRYKTLQDVVNHYSDKIQANQNLDSRLTNAGWGVSTNANAPTALMKMTEREKQSLVAFLTTLTDQKYITDERFADPFK